MNRSMRRYSHLLVLLLLVAARSVTSNASHEEDDGDKIMDFDDTLPVPTPGPTEKSDEPVHATGEASSPGGGNKAPDITPYLNVHPLPVPTHGSKAGHPLPVPTVPSPSSSTDSMIYDRDPGSFGQGAYPTESMHAGDGASKTRGSSDMVGGGAGGTRDQENDDLVGSFGEGAYPSDSTTNEAGSATGRNVPTLGPVDLPSAKKSASSFGDGAYPNTRVNGDEPKDIPTVYPKEPSVYPKEVKNEDTVGISEGGHPPGTITKDKPIDIPTVYPKEPSVYPEEDENENTVSLSEGSYPADTTVKDEVREIPTVYPKEPSVYPNELESDSISMGESDSISMGDTDAPAHTPSERGVREGDSVNESDDTIPDTPATNEKEVNDHKESKPEAPAKEGSLASFFEKVNKKKEQTQDNLSDTFAAASQVYTAQAKKEGLYVGDTKKSYRGIWGELRSNQSRPNMMVLFELFQDAFVEAITGSHTQAQAEALVDDMGEILASKTAPVDVDKVMAAEPDKVEISNTFVDGLDDIDKLFEDVDPPDELDIASFGSSMQEILTGRVIHIARKRLMMGVDFVKESFVKTKVTVVTRFTSGDGKIRFISKDELKQTGRATINVLKRSYTFVKELVVDLMDSGEADTDTDDSIILGDIQEQIQKQQQRAVPP